MKQAFFPIFVNLELEDKDEYNAFVANYPPFSDLSFPSLHIWWNLDGRLQVSNLNDNLVINYSSPFDKDSSGLSLVGINKVDESIRTIFNYLKSQSKPLRLVHVPEFVVEIISDKRQFKIFEEPNYHEYIMSSEGLAKLEGGKHEYTRKKVKRFLREVQNKVVEVKAVDLASGEVRNKISRLLEKWQNEFAKKNDPERNEDQAIKKTLTHFAYLDTKNLCLYIDGRLHGILLYHQTPDKKHFILNHLKVDYSVPYMFDFMTNQIAKIAVQQGVEYLNMEMDLGIEGLRKHKARLRPVSYFKKYTLSPSGNPD